MALRYEVQMKLFEPEHNLPVLTEVPFRPKAGFQYIYKWESSSKRKDWRSDGYRWRQNATVKFNHGDIKCKRYYFKLKVGPGNDYTMDFSKHAIESPLYEKQMLVWYQGDDSVVVDFSHGNAKNAVLNQILPNHEDIDSGAQNDSEMADAATEDNTDPNTSEAVQTQQKPSVIPEPFSLDAVYNLVELRSETGFVSDIHLAPGLLVTCFQESTVMEFKDFLFREDLSTQCLYYDTSITTEYFNISILSFRQTEFEEAPLIPLMFMIYEKKMDSVHNFFFSRLNEILPDLKTSEKVVIISEEEEAVVKALNKFFPDLRRFRCWIRSLRDIKEHLRTLEITDEETIENYENDLICLVNQQTPGEYKALLATMYLKKWKKEFSNFFDQKIDPDMERMSSWALQPFEIPLSSHEELYISILHQFNGWKALSIDNIVVSLMRITEYLNDRVTRGRIRLGDFTMKENLSITYCQGDAAVAERISIDQLVNSIEAEIRSRKKGKKRMIKPSETKTDIGNQEPSGGIEEEEHQRQISEAVDSLASVVQELLEDEMC